MKTSFSPFFGFLLSALLNYTCHITFYKLKIHSMIGNGDIAKMITTVGFVNTPSRHMVTFFPLVFLCLD